MRNYFAIHKSTEKFVWFISKRQNCSSNVACRTIDGVIRTTTNLNKMQCSSAHSNRSIHQRSKSDGGNEDNSSAEANDKLGKWLSGEIGELRIEPASNTQPLAREPHDSKEDHKQSTTMAKPVAAFSRSWITTPFGCNHSKNNATKFTLMSYNILAQSLLHANQDLYDQHHPDNLQWPHRFRCLIDEITRMRPNILTLQEVQDEHLDTIKGHLHGLGLTSHIYKMRTGGQDDGCAIFYNADMFDEVCSEMVEYYQPNSEVVLNIFMVVFQPFL